MLAVGNAFRRTLNLLKINLDFLSHFVRTTISARRARRFIIFSAFFKFSAKVQHQTAKTCQFEEKNAKELKKIENHVQFFSHFRYNRGVGARGEN